MNEIDPLQAYGAVNPSMLHWLAEQEEAHHLHHQQAQQSQGAAKAVPQTYRAYHVHPNNPMPWITKEMDLILERARRFFRDGDYKNAVEEYRDFFNYLRHYGMKLGDPLRAYVPVFYEMRWAMNQQGHQSEAIRIYNHFLAQLLEEMQNQGSAPIRDTITEMQRMDRLPAEHDADRVKADTKALEELSQLLAAQNKPVEAGLMLDFAQLQLGLEQMRLADQEKTLEAAIRRKNHGKNRGAETQPAQNASANPLPRLVVPQWLPYAPTQGFVPFDPELQHHTHPAKGPILPTNAVDALLDLSPDPNPDSEQQRRSEGGKKLNRKNPKR